MAKKDLATRLREKQKKLAESSGEGWQYILFKDGTKRIRIVPPGEDNDWGTEVVFFWLGDKLRTYISPATFGEKCAIMDFHKKMKASSDESDNEMANKVFPKQRFIVIAVPYKDDKGKEVDTDNACKPAILIKDVYQQLLDMYLDEEGGDFTDPINGFDVKIKRSGQGQKNTKYNAIQCKPSKLAKEYRQIINPEDVVRKLVPTYEQSKEILKQFLAGGSLEEGDEKPKKKSSGEGSVKKKKKKKKDL